MKKILIIIFIIYPTIVIADQGINLTCVNMLSNFGKIYKPVNYRLDAMSFEYFDESQNKIISIPTKNLEFGDDYFVVKFNDYELGFQKIIFDGDDEPTVTMSKYDFINSKFIDHYKCDINKS
tara:strand:+ start:760 stop:1125 length:366 start_codon:yes stop_codon:yes gene_type:complete